MSYEERQKIICEACPFPGGCESVDGIYRALWGIRHDFRNELLPGYEATMAEEGIQISRAGVCIKGLIEKYPDASADWLGTHTFITHHASADKEADRIDGLGEVNNE